MMVACHWNKSSPMGPALQFEGGSFCRSINSCLFEHTMHGANLALHLRATPPQPTTHCKRGSTSHEHARHVRDTKNLGCHSLRLLLCCTALEVAVEFKRDYKLSRPACQESPAAGWRRGERSTSPRRTARGSPRTPWRLFLPAHPRGATLREIRCVGAKSATARASAERAKRQHPVPASVVARSPVNAL